MWLRLAKGFDVFTGQSDFAAVATITAAISFDRAFGYYIAGVRHLTAYAAGASKLEYHVFAAFAYGGAALWCGTFLTLGYLLGERWNEILEVAHKFGLAAAGVIAVAALIYGVWWYMKRRSAASGSPE